MDNRENVKQRVTPAVGQCKTESPPPYSDTPPPPSSRTVATGGKLHESALLKKGLSKLDALVASGIVGDRNQAKNYTRKGDPGEALRAAGWKPGKEPPTLKTLWYPPDGLSGV